MTNVLLALIAGILGVNLFLTHAVSKEGKMSWDEVWVLLGFIILASAIFYGLALIAAK